MSVVKLGQINLSKLQSSYDFIVYVSLDASSGYSVPTIVTTIEQFNKLYEDCYQKKLCELLLSKGIPLLTLPIVSYTSKVNKSSLQLNEGNVIYCHPRLENSLEEKLPSFDKLASSLIYKDSNSFSMILDFRKLPSNGDNLAWSDNEQYLILPCIVEEKIERRLLTYKSKYPIAEDYYDGEPYQSEQTTVSGLFNHIISFGKEFGFTGGDLSGELLKILEANSDLFPTIDSSLTVSENYQIYCETLDEFITKISEYLWYLDEYSRLVEDIEKTLQITIVDEELKYQKDNQPCPEGDNVLKRLEPIINSLSRILILKYNKLIRYHQTNHIDGLKVLKSKKFDEKLIDDYVKDKRLFCVVSRDKGPKSNNIKVKISRYKFLENSYIVTISNGQTDEVYYINTDISVDISNTIMSRVQVIDENSKLVSLRIFDYVRENGERVDKRYLTDEEFIKYPDFVTHGELRVYKLLPDGYDELEFNLSNGEKEILSLNSRERNIDILNSLDYYPDFFLEDYPLIDSLWSNEKLESINNYQEKLYNYCCSKFSQALINYKRSFLEKFGSIYNIDYKESRVLKFFGRLTINEKEVCCFYPYIENFINSEFLAIINDTLISKMTTQPDELFYDKGQEYEEIKETLIKYKFNFIEFDNLRYFYSNIREPNMDPSFIIRFCISKLSRVVMDSSNKIINCNPNYLGNVLAKINEKILRLLPLISNLSYSYEQKDHDLNLTFRMDIPKIVNKTLVMNITLNY